MLSQGNQYSSGPDLNGPLFVSASNRSGSEGSTKDLVVIFPPVVLTRAWIFVDPDPIQLGASLRIALFNQNHAEVGHDAAELKSPLDPITDATVGRSRSMGSDFDLSSRELG